ncbi:MAG TPA: hypothetical protein VHE30_14145 [Polyangiaceae bacterium]|nr:hypothetical protein [Polyangiaceae bacterium]
MMRAAPSAVLFVAFGCSGTPTEESSRPSSTESTARLEFSPDVPPSEDEAYLCYGFDVSPILGGYVRGVRWTLPDGGVALHHAKLWVTKEVLPTTATPFSCDPVPPDETGIHLWVLGGSELELPPDTGLALPEDARTIVVEAHAVRVSDAPAAIASVAVRFDSARPARVARHLGLDAPVPAIRPETRERSATRCRFDAAFHAFQSLPHMHRVGAEFVATHQGPAAEETFLHVDPWDFEAQVTYPTLVDFEPGDAVWFECIWENPTASYVLPGNYSKDEMCTFGLVGWPASAATCVPEEIAP